MQYFLGLLRSSLEEDLRAHMPTAGWGAVQNEAASNTDPARWKESQLQESKGERDEGAGANPREADWELIHIQALGKPAQNLLLWPTGTWAGDGARPDAAARKAGLLVLVTHSQTCFLSLGADSYIFCCLRY